MQCKCSCSFSWEDFESSEYLLLSSPSQASISIPHKARACKHPLDRIVVSLSSRPICRPWVSNHPAFANNIQLSKYGKLK